jgi:heavy metal efflux system protein
MIDAIIRFSIKQRVLVMLGVFACALIGLFALYKNSIDALPDITNVQVQVLTTASSLAPLEVERQITFPIELGMSGLPGVKEVRSLSKFGLSMVTVVFDDAVDTYFARQLVLERLFQVRDQIPESVGNPELGPISTGLGEIYQYELRAKDSKQPVGAMDLRTIQDWTVRRQLMGTAGIAEVNSFGGQKKQYQVRLDAAKLQAYGLTMHDALQAVLQNNANTGGAYIEHASEQYVLRGVGLAENAAELGKITVKTGRSGVPVMIRELGEVTIAPSVRQGAVLADGQGEIVAGIVMMLKGENSKQVIERVKDRVVSIQKSLPENVELVPFYDRSALVDRTIHTIQTNLFEGALLVIVVLLLVLGNWRGSLLVASVIPLSMLFASICMWAFKVPGNLMSLGAIDFGLIVDGAVVMVENTIRRLAMHGPDPAESSKSRILTASLEVGRPVVFAVAIIAIVYLPIMSLTGIEGRLFKPMAMTIVFALIGSLILTLTYVPAAMTFVFPKPVAERESAVLRPLKSLYRKGLAMAIHHRLPVVSAALVLVIASGIAFPFLGSEFIPRLDEGALAVQIQQVPSISLTQSIDNATRAEKIIGSFPEVSKVVSKIGRAEVAIDPMGVDVVDMYVGLKPHDQWKAPSREQLVEQISERLNKEIPEANFSFSQPVELRTAELIAGVKSDIAIKVFGDDLTRLKELGEQVSRAVSTVDGAADVKVEQTAGLPQLIIKPRRDVIARYDIEIEQINDIVESLVAGKVAGAVFEGDQKFDIVVRFEPEQSANASAVASLLVPTPKGALVPLRELAEVQVQEGPAQISREDRRRRIGVELNVRGRDIGSFVAAAKKTIDERVNLPDGYYIQWGGQFENLERASATLAVVVPIALFLIFVLLYMSFGSVWQSLLIYSGIPFALVGGIFALAARGMPFSISAAIGFIALSGVAVLNGVVMVSYINALRESGLPLLDAVWEGAITRFRPVLMTALVASLGFIPMAISTSSGAEVQKPLATVVIGGLFTSSILTLLILPILYLWVGRRSPAKPGASGGEPSLSSVVLESDATPVEQTKQEQPT